VPGPGLFDALLGLTQLTAALLAPAALAVPPGGLALVTYPSLVRARNTPRLDDTTVHHPPPHIIPLSAPHTKQATCTARTAGTMSSAQLMPLASTCQLNPLWNVDPSYYIFVLPACAGGAAAVPAYVYATQRLSSPTFTVAQARSKAFQQAFASVVAAAVGVLPAAVNVTSVAMAAAGAGARRQLLATVAVTYAVATTQAGAAAVAATLQSPALAAAVGTGLSTLPAFPGLTVSPATTAVGAPTAAPTAAPTTPPSAAPTTQPSAVPTTLAAGALASIDRPTLIGGVCGAIVGLGCLVGVMLYRQLGKIHYAVR
jgi:hypothetical protein